MKPIRPIAICLNLCALIALAAGSVAAQQAPTDPQNNPRKEKKEKGNPLADWAEKDVTPIMTPDELRAWKLLKTDEEREAFIIIFWRLRDTDPDTEANEYREAYYERMQYANEHFSSGKPGYLTDRGRIYLVYGKPDEIESHPSGGSYQGPTAQSSADTTYPFEIWFYRHLPNVGNGLELEFVDRTGSGEFRLANSPDEKNALINVPGHQSPGGLMSINAGYQRVQDNPIEIMIRNANLFRPPPVDYSGPTGIRSDSGQIDNSDQLTIDVHVDTFRQSDRSAVAAITVQTLNNELVFMPNGEIHSAQVNIWGKVTSVDQRTIARFQDSVKTNATTAEVVDFKGRRSAYQKVISLPPGTYKVDVFVRDLYSPAVGHKVVNLTVPKFDGPQVALSSIVLASRLETLGTRAPGSMFTIGDKKVMPNIAGEFRRGQDLGIYAQVYNAGIDETTLRPSVEVSYAILKNGADIYRQAEDWTGMSETGQRMTLARIFPTAALTPGTYQLVISLKDKVTGSTLTRAADFSVIP
ncbi:MAG: GWxTD domain-containing protein [Pyrinomonadaceae bacterium]